VSKIVIASEATQSTFAFLLPHGLRRCARSDGLIPTFYFQLTG